MTEDAAREQTPFTRAYIKKISVQMGLCRSPYRLRSSALAALPPVAKMECKEKAAAVVYVSKPAFKQGTRGIA